MNYSTASYSASVVMPAMNTVSYHSSLSPSFSESSLETIVHYSAGVYGASEGRIEITNLNNNNNNNNNNSPYTAQTGSYRENACSYTVKHHSNNTYHVVDNFLHIYRPETQFIGDAKDVQEYIKETFRLTTSEELPDDIMISVCSAQKLKEIHSQFGNNWSNGIQGFSLNKTRAGLKEVFVKEGDLDRIMLVIGHEIGHVMSSTLANKHDEEAKAFAFEFAWMETIVKHNIANLRYNINLDFVPAQNGLHDIAFGFVKNVIGAGNKALAVFRNLISGETTIERIEP